LNARKFLAELQRRNVYKVAVAYAVVSWLLIQIATQIFPFFEIPSWAVRLVVLIDHGSASASEIVAGALQDRGRATLIGETSYGKGTVQQWQELTGNGGAFKLTVARWLTPNGHSIHQKGLTPDIPVTVPSPAPAGTDPVLDRAVDVLTGTGSSVGWQAAA